MIADVERVAREALSIVARVERVRGPSDWATTLRGLLEQIAALSARPVEAQEMERLRAAPAQDERAASEEAARRYPSDLLTAWQERRGAFVAGAAWQRGEADVPAAPTPEVDRSRGDGVQWTFDQWQEWSNEVASAMPESWDGDEAQEDLILRFVRHATAHLAACPEVDRYTHECEQEYATDADGRDLLLNCRHPEHDGEVDR